MPRMSNFHQADCWAWFAKQEKRHFGGVFSSDHYHPWAPLRRGTPGFVWSWLGAAMSGDRLSVRADHRAGRLALSSRRPSPSRRHPGRDVSRPPTLDRGRQRRTGERAHHRRGMAGEAGAQCPAARRCRDNASPAARRRGDAPGTDCSIAGEDLFTPPAGDPPCRRRRQRSHCRMAWRMGGRFADRRPWTGFRPQSRRGLPPWWRREQACLLQNGPLLGAGRARGACPGS